MRSVELFQNTLKLVCPMPDMKTKRSEHTINNIGWRSSTLVCGGNGGNRTCEKWKKWGEKWEKMTYKLSHSFIGHVGWSYRPWKQYYTWGDMGYWGLNLMLLSGKENEKPEKVWGYYDDKSRPWGEGQPFVEDEYPIENIHYAR